MESEPVWALQARLPPQKLPKLTCLRSAMVPRSQHHLKSPLSRPTGRLREIALLTLSYTRRVLQDYAWHPYNVMASAAQCGPGDSGLLAPPSHPLAQAVGQAALATSDFAAQLAYINGRLPPDDDRSRARLNPKCQVHRPSGAPPCLHPPSPPRIAAELALLLVHRRNSIMHGQRRMCTAYVQ